MKTRNSIQDFTGLYKLQKTLRFALIPQGKTKEHIESGKLIEDDEKLAKDYEKVKKIIDRYHQWFLEQALEQTRIEGLNEFAELYFKPNKSDKETESLEKLQDDFRKQIKRHFAEHPKWKILFKKELIQQELYYIAEDEEKEILDKFYHFTTYFTGFHENRKNIYTDEPIATAVGYRLVHENLPKFLDNVRVFRNALKKYPDLNFSKIETEMEDVLQGLRVEDLFAVEYFNETLTQTGIDLYNTVLGGRTLENGTKIQGVNELINLFRQKNGIKPRELPNLKPLFKQILSDRESVSFLPEKLETDKELFDSISGYYTHLQKLDLHGRKVNVLKELQELFTLLPEADSSGLFIRGGQPLTNLSNKLFGHWQVINDALALYFEKVHSPLNGKRVTKKYEESRKKWLKSKYFRVSVIVDALNRYAAENEDVREKWQEQRLFDYWQAFDPEQTGTSLIAAIDNAYREVQKLADAGKLSENAQEKRKQKAVIKAFLDTAQELLHFVKTFYIEQLDEEKDEGFYGHFDPLYNELARIVPLYNKVRNYLTRKPYSTEKFKLNFRNSTLLDGWDENKEKDNTGILLEKDGYFYLAIMDKKHNKVFADPDSFKPAGGEEFYNKIRYKLLPGPNKMLPKVFFSRKGLETFNPPATILENYKKGTHKVGVNFNLTHCHQLIDFFKSAIAVHPDWKQFNFSFSPTQSFKDINQFYTEVEQQGYKLEYVKVSAAYLDRLVEEGKVYLFQIYNKDFSPYSKGKPNLHTMYWKALFDKENLADVVYKLNGQAEVFFRKKSLNYTEEQWKKGHHAEELKGRFDYPIIKDRRYAVDKFMFHVPITINFKAGGRDYINFDIRNALRKNPDVKIIGIDRGERHLLYLSLIDRQGHIIEQFTLNEIISSYGGHTFRKDYHKLLSEKEQQRDEARKSWDTIETIKELKEGYLSQVVHLVTRLMVEHNAIVVLEGLNSGFKRGRQKVEKQVYQKFEKMLIDKLNYLVFKDHDKDTPGGVLRGLQLANKFESFAKLGKQSGFLFYVPASFTSKIDPLTGFVDFLKPKYESVEKSKKFFGRFDQIRYNPANDWFEFSFDYKNFSDRAVGTRTTWTVCTTHHPRYRWNRTLNNGKGGQELIEVVPRLKTLFENHGIVYREGQDLKEAIRAREEAPFFRELMFLLAVTLQLRHNNGEKGKEEKDYILSPVADRQGKFFNSLDAPETLPKDADANGAYHIALKGLQLLRKMDETPAEELNKIKLAMSNDEWLSFVHNLRWI